MNCHGLDELLDRSKPSSEWPAEAREHLAACPRCRALAETLSRITASGVHPGADAVAARLLAEDLTPVRRLPPLPLEVMLLALCTAGVGALLAAATGNKGWAAQGAGQRSIIFPAILALVAGQSLLVALEMEPGRGRGRVLRILHWLAPAVFTIGAFVLFRYDPEEWFPRHLALCFARGLATAAAALAAAWLLARRGYFVDLRQSGAALGLLAGLGAFLSQELYCPVLETTHVTMAHIGLLVTCSLTGYLLGAFVAHRE